MDIKLGNKYPAGTLSNLAPHKFTFRGIECNSMEGLLQGLKFKDAGMQEHICTLVGKKAKMSGKGKNWQRTQTLWWQGEPMERKSDEYADFLKEAYDCLFRQNEKARKALVATQKATLQHSIGHTKVNETILTRTEFCRLLTNIRNQINAEEFLEFDDGV